MGKNIAGSELEKKVLCISVLATLLNACVLHG